MSESAYDSKDQNYFEDARQEMAAFIPRHAKNVLEIGCGNATFAAKLKSQRNVHITAIEAYEPAANVARSRVDRVICANIEEAIPSLAGQRFDCIVLNDVLEHLVDPWRVLNSLHPLLAADGAVVASIPNVRYLPVLKDYMLRADWTYKGYGVLDRTHVRFFTRNSIQSLFDESGYSLNDIKGINSLKFSWKMALLNFALCDRLGDTRFKQFACVARATSEKK